MSYTQILYHIIFSTKNRAPVLHEENRMELYNYLWGILKHKNCHVYRIGGTDNHIHLFTSIHPTACLSEIVRDLKTSSSSWIKNKRIFPEFIGWQGEYGAFTKSHSEYDKEINCIKEQKEHHKKESFIDEFRRLLMVEEVAFDERYLR